VLIIFFEAMVVLLLVATAATLLARFLPAGKKVLFCSVVYTLLFTPSWAPATIVMVPIPFGLILGFGAVIGAPNEILDLLLVFWWWHIPAFFITGFVSRKVAKKLVGTSSVKERHT
jgi:uncharacterized membrane protein